MIENTYNYISETDYYKYIFIGLEILLEVNIILYSS